MSAKTFLRNDPMDINPDEFMDFDFDKYQPPTKLPTHNWEHIKEFLLEHPNHHEWRRMDRQSRKDIQDKTAQYNSKEIGYDDNQPGYNKANHNLGIPPWDPRRTDDLIYGDIIDMPSDREVQEAHIHRARTREKQRLWNKRWNPLSHNWNPFHSEIPVPKTRAHATPFITDNMGFRGYYF
jgi:hypothetical protein